MYPLALGLTKISLLFMYRRIFSISRRMRVIIVTTIVLVGAWMVALFFAELFQCSTKFWANWGSSYDIRTQCNKTTMIVFAVCLTDSIFDLTILVMPIPLVCPRSFLLKGCQNDILADLAIKVIDWKENWVAFDFPTWSRVRLQLFVDTRQFTDGTQHGHGVFGPPGPRHSTCLHTLRG